MKPLAIIAIGGNSLITDNKHLQVEDQYRAICETTGHIASIIEKGYKVVVTHGNGPQVGFIMRRSEIAEETQHMHPVPLVSCDADTQGAIGYQIQQALQNEFTKRDMEAMAVTIVTQVEVNPVDEAFLNPSKPIGSFYEESQIEHIRKEHPDWVLRPDAGRGYRRVVPSPKPLHIVECGAIEALVDKGFTVIGVGGGGIPVMKGPSGILTGVNAVIDKDHASSLLASYLHAEYLIISTAVPNVYLNYGTKDQKALHKVTLSEMKTYMAQGHFAQGSMLPKIEAAMEFMARGGKRAIITCPQWLEEAIEGRAGTMISH